MALQLYPRLRLAAIPEAIVALDDYEALARLYMPIPCASTQQVVSPMI